MQDHLLFGHIYIPGFMVLVLAGIAMLSAIKFLIGSTLLKLKIVNPPLVELCLVIIITGQLLLLKVN